MKYQVEGGGPAFPSTREMAYAGMTLRDWFAGQTLTGILANPDISEAATKSKLSIQAFRENAAIAAFAMADAMLKAREPKETK